MRDLSLCAKVVGAVSCPIPNITESLRARAATVSINTAGLHEDGSSLTYRRLVNTDETSQIFGCDGPLIRHLLECSHLDKQMQGG
jgi:hypothetical protein